MNRLTVRVPGSTANLGPGFDCLAMALELWNTLTFEVLGAAGEKSAEAGNQSKFTISGEGEGEIEGVGSNLVLASFRRVFEEIGRNVPAVDVDCQNEVPLHRGLGSSSTAVVGGLVAANEVSGRTLSTERLLELAVEIEGHPDNVSAALFGGCRVVVRDGANLVAAPIPFPEDLKAVAFIPDVPMPTEEARGLLPPTVSREDAVYNIGRASLLSTALATGDLSQLAIATQDRLHQTPRQAIFPAMKRIFDAALVAGALGAFLSGAGSTVLALATEKETAIGESMRKAAEGSGVTGRVKVMQPSRIGAHVVEAD